jgi:hypothetical protein
VVSVGSEMLDCLWGRAKKREHHEGAMLTEIMSLLMLFEMNESKLIMIITIRLLSF